MERQQLIVAKRTAQGSGPAQRMRREGVVPGVVYGRSTKPMPIAVNRRELMKFLRARVKEHGVLTLKIDADPAAGAGKPWEKPVLIKAVEYDPVIGDITHIDFHAIVLTEQLRVKVPLVLKGEPVGVKQDRGVLEHFLREIEVECLPTAIPNQLEYDVSALKLGDAIHVKDLVVPSGAKIVTEASSVIASVLAPKEEKLEEAAPTVTEPEVIREKKPDAEEGEASAGGKEEKTAEKAEKKEKKE